MTLQPGTPTGDGAAIEGRHTSLLTMKIASLVLLATAVHGFAPAVRLQRVSFLTPLRMSETSTAPSDLSSDFASAMPEAEDPDVRLGVSKDQVALGVDVNEILQWIGT